MQQFQIYSSIAMDDVLRVFMNESPADMQSLDLGKGVSSFNVFDYTDIHLTPRELSEYTGYGEINGLHSLRCSIARFYGEKYNYDLNPERVCITDGASGALTLAYALLSINGGNIIIPECCYPVYRIFSSLFALQTQTVNLSSDFNIDLISLRKTIDNNTAALVLNSPSNPFGSVLTDSDLEEICNLGVPVIFDEVYQALPLSTQKIPSAIHYADQHFIVNSFSKSLSIAGFRLGYIVVPEQYIDKMTNAKATMNICTSLPSQSLGERLLRQWDFLIEKHQEMLKKNWEKTAQELSRHHLRLRAIPKAGFFAPLDVSDLNKNSFEVSLDLAREYALNTAPGVDFCSSDPKFIRLNFACPYAHIAPAIERIAQYMSDHKT